MKNNEIINGISAILSAINAYHALKQDVLDYVSFERAACAFIENLCIENEELCKASCLYNGNEEAGITIGEIKVPVETTESIYSVLHKCIPKVVLEKSFFLETKVDFSSPFSILLNIDGNVECAKMIMQQMVVLMIKFDKSLEFRCGDFVTGGAIFSDVHKIVSKFPERTGGKVYTKQNELSDIISFFDKAKNAAMSKLDSMSENKRYLGVIYLNELQYRDDFEELRVVIENGKRYGMSFIIAGNRNVTRKFSALADFEIGCTTSGAYIGGQAVLPYEFKNIYSSIEGEIKGMLDSLENLEMIDTRYENHTALHTSYFGMDSTEAVRIPFAIDKNNTPLYFEIGGKAPAHALIAGSTGSGKTSVLHTIIMQLIHNYHPDDVEIWAIDYKAVEFAPYIDCHTPHFKVIAYDNSMEFSLSLIDLLYEEYERRQHEFLKVKKKDIEGYREVCGKHAMPRIVVIIDEFQLMTQAVREYSGKIDYRTKLENLFRLTRAMGISFILCSQSIASGLSALSEPARGQIGCRLCLKHEQDNEIRETLVLSGEGSAEIVEKVKKINTGRGIYKRARWIDEYSPDGQVFEFLDVNVLYFDEQPRQEILDTANILLKGKHTPKKEIFVRGGGRIYLSEKEYHPIIQFINGQYEIDSDCVEWYPAAPTTLADAFCVQLDNSDGANMLIVGEDDDLRESVVLHSVCGFLMDPNNRVIVSIIDENHPDRMSMINQLKKIDSERLSIHEGISSCLEVILGLKKIRPTPGKNTIYIWYGIEKIKNEMFLMKQDEDECDIQEEWGESASKEDLLEDLMAFLSDINGSGNQKSKVNAEVEDLSFDDCKNILKQAFDVGPENNKFHMVIFNNRKVMKKSGFIELDMFENRIGTRMSIDDSYELFGSSLAITKANEGTVVYYDGTPSVVPLRPYQIADKQWYDIFNQALKNYDR